MEDKSLYSIGEIASICRISTHRLRHYEKKGIIAPVYIDEDTGWRFYSNEQVFYIDMIKELREQDFNLSEIKNILHVRNLHRISNIYFQKKEKLDKEINTLMKAKELITHRLSDFQGICQETDINDLIKQLNITLKHISERTVLYIEKREKISPEMFVSTHNEMRKIIEKFNMKTASPCMVVYYEDYEVCTDIVSHVDICKGVILDNLKTKYKHVKTIPANLYATIVFNGAREASLKNYRILKDWIDKNFYKVIGPVIKIYHTDGIHTQDVEKLVGELQIPVQAK